MSRFRLRYNSADLDIPPGSFLIGRSEGCHLVLDDGLVSRRHAVLHTASEKVCVEDLESRNGVCLNGRRIPPNDPRPLEHLDRMTVGAQELIFVDVEKQQASMRPSTICPSCGTKAFAKDLHCRGCGKPMSFSRRPHGGGATLEMTPLEIPNAAKEDPVSGLELVTTLANKTLSMGRAEEAERLLQSHFQRLLQQAIDGSAPPTPADLETATLLALRLASRLGRPRWVDWVFEIHTASRRMMPSRAIDQLYELVRKIHYEDPRPLRAYLAVLHPDALAPAERFLFKRLEGLIGVLSA